ncbi:MAG: gliding motility protein GldN [Bacteroidota bacterium]
MKTLKKLFYISILGLFAFQTNAQVLDAPVKIVNRAWEKNESGDGHVSNRQVIPFAHLREADVMWASRVWRQLDLREKMNLPLYFPEYQIRDRISLTQVLWNAVVVEGSVRAFDDEDFVTPLTVASILTATSDSASVTVQSQLDPSIDSVVSSVTKFESKNVKKYFVKEDWFFDRQRSVLDVRIIGICPMLDNYITNNETGEQEFKGLKKLFWVYFPEARSVFVKNEVYNRQNDAERRSFDDLFQKRFFSSYIIKQENVFDRSIQDYEKGLNALIEGEKIKEDIFTFEQDLWEY